jgi:hypothetical protein
VVARQIGTGTSLDRDALPEWKLVVIADQLQRRGGRIAPAEQPAQVGRCLLQRRPHLRGEEPGVFRVRAAMGAGVGQGSPHWSLIREIPRKMRKITEIRNPKLESRNKAKIRTRKKIQTSGVQTASFRAFRFHVVSDCLMSACGLGTSFEIRISRRSFWFRLRRAGELSPGTLVGAH